VRVVFTKAYPDPIAEEFMRQAGLELVRMALPGSD
jgi:hypothetical protein